MPLSRNWSCCADVAGRQADALEPVLIERKSKRRHALAPIAVGRSHQRAGVHDGECLRRDVTQRVGVGPHHTERHGKGRVGAEHQLGHPHAGFRRQAIGHRLTQSEFEGFARLFAVRQDDDFRERGIG